MRVYRFFKIEKINLFKNMVIMRMAQSMRSNRLKSRMKKKRNDFINFSRRGYKNGVNKRKEWMPRRLKYLKNAQVSCNEPITLFLGKLYHLFEVQQKNG